MFTREELIEALKNEGLEFDEVCDFGDSGQIKWEQKFDALEADHGEIGFAPEMQCDIDEDSISFCSILNDKTIFFNKDFPNPPTLEEIVEESKRIIEEFYRDLY